METSTHNAPAPTVGLRSLLGQPHANFFAMVDTLNQDGGRTRLDLNESILPVRHEGNYSGFRFVSEGWIQGHILIGVAPQGGFIVRTAFAENGFVTEQASIYSEAGALIQTEQGVGPAPKMVERLEMDLDCPVMDFLYNFLAMEYARANAGEVPSTQVHVVERFLRGRKVKGMGRSLERRRDPLFRHVFGKMLLIEADPVLKWEERQVVYDNLVLTLRRALKVKRRALGMGALGQTLFLMRFRWANFAKRCKMRPWDNARGLFYKHTVEKIIWFCQTVKNNLGYSVALAVYGPFTYYFITMPMNPHAMQAVGRVRSAYIDTKTVASNQFSKLLPHHQDSATQTQSQGAPATTTAQAIPASLPETNDMVPSRVVAPTGAARRLNMLLSVDVPEVDNQPWGERMGNMKQMQIAYEEGLDLASRMGRLEQLETQYNFPMMVESAWEEMERYNAQLFRLRQRHPEISPRLKQYLTNEVNRTHQLQLYLWDRMARFILDQPYVMLDQDREQRRSDYYVGRAFVFMEEMNKIMGWRYPDFKRPQGHEKITAAAAKYQKGRQEKGDILANLKANSDMFKQQDPFDTRQFRSHMKRQWEILYLQNAKAEEASNNGFNMYMWSVRNTVWALQSIYSAKRLEVDILLQRDLEGAVDGASTVELAKIEGLYETLYHNLALEWVGIRNEIGERLPKDIENQQRRVVVENLREFLTDRAKLPVKLAPAATATIGKAATTTTPAAQ